MCAAHPNDPMASPFEKHSMGIEDVYFLGFSIIIHQYLKGAWTLYVQGTPSVISTSEIHRFWAAISGFLAKEMWSGFHCYFVKNLPEQNLRSGLHSLALHENCHDLDKTSLDQPQAGYVMLCPPFYNISCLCDIVSLLLISMLTLVKPNNVMSISNGFLWNWHQMQLLCTCSGFVNFFNQ